MKQLIFLWLFLTPLTIYATETTWTGGGLDSLWSNTANWSDGVPSGGDTAVINQTTNQPFVTSPNQLARLIVNVGAVLTIEGQSALFTLQGIFNSDPNVLNFGTIINNRIFQMNSNSTGIENNGVVINNDHMFFAEYEIGIQNNSGAQFTNNSTMDFNTVFTSVVNQGNFTNDGTLSGDLILTGDPIVNNGTLSPGNSPGTIDFTGGLILGDSSVYQCEIFGTSPGQSDLISASTAVLNGRLMVTFEDGFVPMLDDTFKIMDYASASGAFVEFVLPDISPYTLSPVQVANEFLLAVQQPTVSNYAVIQNASLSIDDIGEGIILKSPDGSCWKVSVGDDGSLMTESVTCPEE